MTAGAPERLIRKARGMKQYAGLKVCAVLAALAIMGVGGVAEAATIVPGETIASRLLQIDTLQVLMVADGFHASAEGDKDCDRRKVVNTEVVQRVRGVRVEGGRPVSGYWSERWTLDRCGKLVPYIVDFTTDRTGTKFEVDLEQ